MKHKRKKVCSYEDHVWIPRSPCKRQVGMVTHWSSQAHLLERRDPNSKLARETLGILVTYGFD